MHPYLPHLLADIAAARRVEQPEPLYALTFEEEMEEVERWVEGEESCYELSYYCGLNAENFPPATQLNDEEMLLICKAFRNMLYTWNLDADFPESLPPCMTYSLLVNTLNKKTCIPSSGFMTFDFCTGYAPDCIFKEHCPCKEIWDMPFEDDEEPTTPENEVPF